MIPIKSLYRAALLILLISGGSFIFGCVGIANASIFSGSGITPMSSPLTYMQPITIDGVTYTNYSLLSNTQTGANVFANFESAINAPYPVVIVDTGSFTVSKTITMRRDNVLITGRSKEFSKIIQTNPNKDLLQIYANGVTVKNLTLDTKTYNAYAAYVIGDGIMTETSDATLVGNNNTLTRCNILGGNKGFTLYVAGPTYKSSIYTKYVAGELSHGNIITDNYMEGSYVRDAFVFALQKNGQVRNNTFSGGELDIYMSKFSLIESNTSLHSNKAGIFISGPSDNLSINYNTISGAREHGIKSYYQIDNIPIPSDRKYITNSTIYGNMITNSWENGMDLNYLKGGVIRMNRILSSSVHGISLVNESSANHITDNVITDFGLGDRFRGSGIFISAGSTNNSVLRNILSTANNTFTYAWVFIETSDSTFNDISHNTISGKFRTAGIASYDRNFLYGGNTITNYFGWGGEIVIY